MTQQKPLNIEPREVSELEYYAAAHASASGVAHDSLWPGQNPETAPSASVEQIEVQEPSCVTYRKHADFGIPVDVVAKKSPRIPRDTEPAHLHVVLALLVFVGLCVALLLGSMLHGLGWLLGVIAQYADSLVPELVRWIGGVL